MAFTHTPVSSSNIVSVAYDAPARVLQVAFMKGLYNYAGVPQATYDSLMAAESKGEYLARHIKKQYPVQKVG